MSEAVNAAEIEERGLRDLLISLYTSGAHQPFLDTLGARIDTVDRAFPTWTQVPEELRGDSTAVNAWAQALGTIAQIMQRAGYPGPMLRLTGGSENPIERWGRTYVQAQRLASVGEYVTSDERLTGLLAELSQVSGTAVDDLIPKVHGLLGTNALHLGRYRDSIAHTETALRLCQAINDDAGVAAYTVNLDLARLVDGEERDDPQTVRLLSVRKRIASAQDLSDGTRYRASNDLLWTLLAEKSPEVDRYAAKIHGLLGLNLHRLGDTQGARTHTELALAHARRAFDVDGIRVYTANLDVVNTA